MDILVYAIKMELDGEKYYREQAERNRGNSLYAVFTGLAEEESSHAALLEEKSKNLRYRFNAPVHPATRNVFSKLADFKSDLYKNPQQLEPYKMALEKEKESIALYKKLLLESDDCPDLFEFLITQEEEHAAILENIIELLSRPNEWVEAAEFGNRKEY